MLFCLTGSTYLWERGRSRMTIDFGTAESTRPTGLGKESKKEDESNRSSLVREKVEWQGFFSLGPSYSDPGRRGCGLNGMTRGAHDPR